MATDVVICSAALSDFVALPPFVELYKQLVRAEAGVQVCHCAWRGMLTTAAFRC